MLSTVDRYSFHEVHLNENADTLLLTYGVTARAALDVFKKHKKLGKPISLLILKTLWPVPENLIRKKAAQAKRVVVVEMNLGQYVREIERILPEKKIDFCGQMDGRLITPGLISEVVDHA